MENTKILTILVSITLVITVLNLFVSIDLNNKFDSISGKTIAGCPAITDKTASTQTNAACEDIGKYW
jgi:hypothetical protein